MKTRHKINHGWAPNRNDPEWEERVEREAMATTDARERSVAKAAERLARAEARVALLLERQASEARVQAAIRAVESRRQELLEMEALMRSSPAGSVHRGVGSYRPVPQGRSL